MKVILENRDIERIPEERHQDSIQKLSKLAHAFQLAVYDGETEKDAFFRSSVSQATSHGQLQEILELQDAYHGIIGKAQESPDELARADLVQLYIQNLACGRFLLVSDAKTLAQYVPPELATADNVQMLGYQGMRNLQRVAIEALKLKP